MKNRNIGIMIVLTFVTLGIYWIYYYFSTRKELVKLGADVPTAWLIFIPFVNLYFYWQWFKGAEHVTQAFNGAKMFLIAVVGPFVVQIILIILLLASGDAAADADGTPSAMSALVNLIALFVSLVWYIVVFYIQTKFNQLGEAGQQSAVPPYSPPQQPANPQDFQNPQPPQHN